MLLNYIHKFSSYTIIIKLSSCKNHLIPLEWWAFALLAEVIIILFDSVLMAFCKDTETTQPCLFCILGKPTPFPTSYQQITPTEALPISSKAECKRKLAILGKRTTNHSN